MNVCSTTIANSLLITFCVILLAILLLIAYPDNCITLLVPVLRPRAILLLFQVRYLFFRALHFMVFLKKYIFSVHVNLQISL